MRITRLFLAFAVAVLLTACHGTSNDNASRLPVRGNVVSNPAAARANTERAYQLIESGKYADAEPFLKTAIEEDPTYGPAHNDMGIVHFQLARLYDAAWEFQNAVKLMPRQPQPPNNLGLVLETALRFTEAEQFFSQAHELDPQNPEYAGNLARVRIRLGQRDEQTRRLLELVVLADTRADWLEWARFNLARLQALPEDAQPPLPPTSRPSPTPTER